MTFIDKPFTFPKAHRDSIELHLLELTNRVNWFYAAQTQVDRDARWEEFREWARALRSYISDCDLTATGSLRFNRPFISAAALRSKHLHKEAFIREHVFQVAVSLRALVDDKISVNTYAKRMLTTCLILKTEDEKLRKATARMTPGFGTDGWARYAAARIKVVDRSGKAFRGSPWKPVRPPEAVLK